MNYICILVLVSRLEPAGPLDEKCDVSVLISGVTGISYKVLAPPHSMSSVI